MKVDVDKASQRVRKVNRKVQEMALKLWKEHFQEVLNEAENLKFKAFRQQVADVLSAEDRVDLTEWMVTVLAVQVICVHNAHEEANDTGVLDDDD